MPAPRIFIANVIVLMLTTAAPVTFAQSDPSIIPASSPTPQPEQTSTITLPDDPDVPVLEAQQVRNPPADAPIGLEPEIYSWRFFSDGGLELSPYPGGVQTHRAQLEPVVLQQLLDSLDQLYDLPAHQTTTAPNPTQSFVRAQIDRYVSHDWTVAVDYLNVVRVADLEVFFEELHALRQWIVLSDPSDPIWFSGNPWPSICRPRLSGTTGASRTRDDLVPIPQAAL